MLEFRHQGGCSFDRQVATRVDDDHPNPETLAFGELVDEELRRAGADVRAPVVDFVLRRQDGLHLTHGGICFFERGTRRHEDLDQELVPVRIGEKDGRQQPAL